MTHLMRTRILRADAIPLVLFGVFGFLMDFLGYFAGIGAWKEVFLHNPLAVGIVEAHGLAIILALVLVRHATDNDTRQWHLVAMVAHLLFGSCNLIFWQVFINVDGLPLGIVTTIYHFTFVIANGAALLLPQLTSELPAGMVSSEG